MNITSFFFKNKILLTVLTLILCIGGIFAYKDIKRNEDPGFKIRTATVTTICTNMNAEQVNKYVTGKIEDYILEMDEVEHIKSQSYDGLSVIYVDVYETYDNMQPIWDKLRRKVENSKKDLPKGLVPYVNDEFADVFGTIFSITGDNYSYSELKEIADDIQDELLTLDDVGKVNLMGVQKETLYLIYKPNNIINYSLNHKTLESYLSKTNVLAKGGRITLDNTNILIESTSEFNSIDDIKNTPIDVLGKSIKLGDIYDVQKGYEDPPKAITRSNGKNAILFILSMKEGGNILKWSSGIKKEIEILKKNYPIGINFDIQAMQGDYVKLLTGKFVSSLIQSIAIVIAIVLFILGIRTGLIIGLIILCIIISTIFIMEKSGLGLDKISLSALIISLGILVDNSIVIAEGAINELKNKSSDITAKEKEEILASVAGKFQTPLLTVSIITSCAFLPIYLAKSAVSEYTSSLFKVVFITLMFSWFYSVTLLPVLVGKFIKNRKKSCNKKEIKITKFFSPLIKLSLANPKKTIITASIVFFISFVLFNFVPKIFFPDSDRAMFEIRINLPDNADIFATKDVILRIEDFIKTIDSIKNFSSYIGTSAPRYVLSASPVADRSNFGMILVNTTNYKVVSKNIKKVKKFIDKNFPDANSVVRHIPLGPPYDAPVEIRIYGYKTDKIFNYVYAVQEKLKNIQGIYLVKNDWGHKTPRIKVKINNSSALRYGITSENLLESIQSAYDGYKVSSYYEDTTNIPIIYKMDKNLRNSSGKIDSIELYSDSQNKSLPLSQLANLDLDFEYPKIFKRDNRLTVTVQGWIDDTTTADAVIKKMLPDLDKTKWEFGYGYEIGGSYENSKKGNKSISDEIPVAFGAIVLILIAYFNSIKNPLVIALSSIMALTGANIGLFITHSYFGFMTFLGYICLIGIAANNSVILLETIKNVDRISIQKAVRSRVVPIFLTAVTTIGGMLPLWLGQDPMFSSLAIAIVFGLLSSVFITLLVSPCVYMLLNTTNKKEAG